MAQRGLTKKQRVWLGHIKACASSGLSMRAYAERHGFDVQRFYVWKSQLKQLGLVDAVAAVEDNNIDGSAHAPSPLIRAQVVSQPSDKVRPQPSFCAARITLANGITIDVPSGFAPEAIGHLVGAAMRVGEPRR